MNAHLNNTEVMKLQARVDVLEGLKGQREKVITTLTEEVEILKAEAIISAEIIRKRTEVIRDQAEKLDAMEHLAEKCLKILKQMGV